MMTLTNKQKAARDMLLDAMAQHDTTALLSMFTEHLLGRPSLDPTQLEAFANYIRRHAWKLERGDV